MCWPGGGRKPQATMREDEKPKAGGREISDGRGMSDKNLRCVAREARACGVATEGKGKEVLDDASLGFAL